MGQPFQRRCTKNSDVYPAVVLGLAIGMRPRAAARVLWGGVDFERKRLTFKDKTSKEKTRALSAWAVSELQAVHAIRKPAATDTVLGIHPDTVFHRFKKLRDAKGLSANVTLQGLRRKFIETLWKNGVEPQKVAAIAGNSVGVIQKHYAEMTAEQCREEV